MTYDPKKRNASWQMILPGCYVDPAGVGHLFPDELIAFIQANHPQAGFDVNSKADYDLVVEIFTRRVQEERPDAQFKFIKHERESQ